MFDFSDPGNLSPVLQFIILTLIVLGSYYSKAKKTNRHAQLMTIAVLLHTSSILVVMIPSILGRVDLLGALNSGGITTWAHVVSGTLAEIWGLALIAAWESAPKAKMTCMERRRHMRPLLIVWVFALVSGIIVHVLYI